MRKLLTTIFVTAGLVMSSSVGVLAAGSPYTPYGGHTPEETGGLADVWVVAAIGLYLVGMAVIFSISKLKTVLK